MWVCLGLLLTLCLLHGGGAESDGGGPHCQLPPAWRIGEVEPMKEAMGRVTVVALLQASWLFCLVQASRMDGLHQGLESQGLKDVVYMVVNHQGEQAQRLHTMMAQRLSANISLYKQDVQQPDVWQTLKGEKDDFLIYDRCGRLTSQISLPYSIIGQGHIESAIKDAYCKRTCGECTYEGAEIPEECKEKTDAQPDANPVHHDTGHAHNHDHGHGHHHRHPHGHDHGHGHGHVHHGDQHGFHPHDFGHSHDQNHGHQTMTNDHRHIQDQQGVQTQGHAHHGLMPQSQHPVDLGQQQQAEPNQAGPWEEKVRWKSEYSWQGTAGSDNEASPKASWCWHWRRLFGDAGSDQPVGLWHCDEALPASWRWHGLTGGVANHVRETWQWRLPPAAWQQPQPAQWAWPPGVVSWGWQQPEPAQWAWPPGVVSWGWQQPEPAQWAWPPGVASWGWQQPQPAQWAWPPGVVSWGWQQPEPAQWAWPPGVVSWGWQEL